METDQANTNPPEKIAPPQPPRRRWLRRFFLLALGAALAILAAAMCSSPEFHRLRMPVGGPLEGRDPNTARAVAQQDARRLVTELSALHAASGHRGRWETVITEREVNAWLALDLPKNHGGLAGSWGRDARIEFLPGRFRFGCRVGAGPVSAIAWVDAEVRLRAVNQIGIVITDARLGSLPVPSGPILNAVARRLDRIGATTEIRRFGDRLSLLVYIPSAADGAGQSRWLESLLVTTGEVAIAGDTRPAASTK